MEGVIAADRDDERIGVRNEVLSRVYINMVARTGSMIGRFIR